MDKKLQKFTKIINERLLKLGAERDLIRQMIDDLSDYDASAADAMEELRDAKDSLERAADVLSQYI